VSREQVVAALGRSCNTSVHRQGGMKVVSGCNVLITSCEISIGPGVVLGGIFFFVSHGVAAHEEA
jgi:hypothetical protein